MIVIGYDIAIIAGGQVTEPLLTTCWCVGLSKSFYIEMSHSVGEIKCRSWNTEPDFVGLKNHPSQAIMCKMVDLSDKRCPD